jgi:hypothetical protein
MRRTVRVSRATLSEGSYRFKVRDASGETWSKRQVVDCYLGDVARWIELLPSRRSKKGAHV